MINILIISIFVLGYLFIAFEHSTRVNKAAPALIAGVLCWVVFIFSGQNPETVNEQLAHHLGEIASILFFLLGAMTIVELIDMHDGFDIITEHIRTTKKSRLLFILTVMTFFLSALLDNLTTTIVMVSLCGKLLSEAEDRYWFAGLIIIAANAGGAWSPLGDVTTTMLWIGNQITALQIMKSLIIPSLAACLIPLLIAAYRFKGQTIQPYHTFSTKPTERRKGKIVLITGIGGLIFVPVFKTITHLPPFMGIMLVLGLIWIVTTVIHKADGENEGYHLATALSNIDSASILFFLGILLAVGALGSAGILQHMATYLSATLPNVYAICIALGLISALVDNVPLVAAAQGMYSLQQFPTDHIFWQFLALTTGTGGSTIIIGSAAGVAAMGIENISFGWYLKRISWIALLGFFAGVIAFIAMHVL